MYGNIKQWIPYINIYDFQIQYKGISTVKQEFQIPPMHKPPRLINNIITESMSDHGKWRKTSMQGLC